MYEQLAGGRRYDERSGGLVRSVATLEKLPPREREIALLVADGQKTIVIARRLTLSPSTVDTYIQQLKARLKLASRSQIADWVAAHLDTAHPDIGLRASEAGSGRRFATV